jgi:hypothetical protein
MTLKDKLYNNLGKREILNGYLKNIENIIILLYFRFSKV